MLKRTYFYNPSTYEVTAVADCDASTKYRIASVRGLMHFNSAQDLYEHGEFTCKSIGEPLKIRGSWKATADGIWELLEHENKTLRIQSYSVPIALRELYDVKGKQYRKEELIRELYADWITIINGMSALKKAMNPIVIGRKTRQVRRKVKFEKSKTTSQSYPEVEFYVRKK